MGLVTTYPGLLIARMALGVAEGGLFPGVTWYITLWYRRHECGLRMAIFFSAATAAGAFGGLLARGITEMDGIAGKPGWAWIFILEGIVTVAVAIVAKFVIHDKPETYVKPPCLVFASNSLFLSLAHASSLRLSATKSRTA